MNFWELFEEHPLLIGILTILICAAITVLFYATIVYAVLWVLQHFGVI